MDAYVYFILENFKYDSIIEADRALKMHYETTFGIFDHRASVLKGKRPWSSQAYHAGYDRGETYAFKYLLRPYLENGIKDIMTFERYCSLSTMQLNELNAEMSQINKRKKEEEDVIRREEERRMQLLLNGGQRQQPSPGADARAMFGMQQR